MSGSAQVFSQLFENCPPDWDIVELPEAVDFQEGPGILAKDFHDAGVPLLRLKSIRSNFATLSGCNFLDKEKVAKKWDHFRVKLGDMLVSTSATIGIVSEVTEETVGCIPYTGIIRMRPNRDDVDRGFIKYFMKSSLFVQQAEAMASGSVLRHYGPSHLRQMAFPIPPLPEQRAIASILGALDDKIELNRRMNATLESLARAIFKSWFVDFDPVRRNAGLKGEDRSVNGEKTEPDLSPFNIHNSLFPSSFQDSELGKIPDGWTVQSLAEMSELLSGGTPKKSIDRYWNGDLPWISPKAMMTLHAFDSDEHVADEAVGNGTRLVPMGTVLVMVRGMGLHHGVRISQARRDVTFNQDVKALVPSTVHGDFLLFAMLDAGPYLFGKVQASGHGTGVIPTDILQSLRFAVPPGDVLDELTITLTNINDRIHASKMESFTLSTLRDTLLPKLLSGELPVPAALTATQDVLNNA